jgi:DNA replication protein DnaC
MREEWHGRAYWKNRPVEERLSLAQIPPLFEESRLSNYDLSVGSSNAHGAVTEWLTSFKDNREHGTSLLLCGEVGSGRTHLAVSALRGAITSYKQSGCYITAAGYLRAMDDFRNNGGVLSDEYPDGNMLSYLRKVYDVVVIDDADMARTTEYASRELFDLLDTRVNNKLLTIVVSTLASAHKGNIVSAPFGALLDSHFVTASLSDHPQAGTYGE